MRAKEIIREYNEFKRLKKNMKYKPVTIPCQNRHKYQHLCERIRGRIAKERCSEEIILGAVPEVIGDIIKYVFDDMNVEQMEYPTFFPSNKPKLKKKSTLKVNNENEILKIVRITKKKPTNTLEDIINATQYFGSEEKKYGEKLRDDIKMFDGMKDVCSFNNGIKNRMKEFAMLGREYPLYCLDIFYDKGYSVKNCKNSKSNRRYIEVKRL